MCFLRIFFVFSVNSLCYDAALHFNLLNNKKLTDENVLPLTVEERQMSIFPFIELL
jgi:hypothetical protein